MQYRASTKSSSCLFRSCSSTFLNQFAFWGSPYGGADWLLHLAVLDSKDYVFVLPSLTTWLQASYHGVPIVGMAMIGEQPDNLARAVDRGYGLTVSVKKLDTLAQDLETALRRVFKGEPSFRTNAAWISHIMRAHRLTPAEKAAGRFPAAVGMPP